MHFRTARQFDDFARHIRGAGRFALGLETRRFLEIFLEQAQGRGVVLPEGSDFYRAVHDHREVEVEETRVIMSAAEERIFPKAQYVPDGRVNPCGIPSLYLATSVDTAISEIRPWLGEIVTVATMRTARPFRIADLARGHGNPGDCGLTPAEAMGETPIPPEKIDQCVWNSIDNAFSRPVGRDRAAVDYAPTQILSEALREGGFHGIRYKSLFGGETGYNLALFDTRDVEITECRVHRVQRLTITHEELPVPPEDRTPRRA